MAVTEFQRTRLDDADIGLEKSEALSSGLDVAVPILNGAEIFMKAVAESQA
ncbi:hypothetical protein BFJ63_vAg8734 [Fusarium oxysporum f. sp. narcissi]|uniref:Uncharacterized protein n=1 Tax=Fusarium oxysporum f. sp. narcissi TaxID=451672 RepID=A0A4Q2VPB7_FUSOX|nr:hypothetical protein BFJ71_g11243 [Fusarium oxysporum]RYC88335.1 hypothetical protein BFJ63_vAg8734 [Fusarium oxysporum f. sp. narcissi]